MNASSSLVIEFCESTLTSQHAKYQRFAFGFSISNLDQYRPSV
jgi:hypothetical protein